MISLVDEHRQWFKSKIGMDATETARDISFCGHAIHQQDLFIVPDATKDDRFADNPLVTSGPKICFYAGAPLTDPKDHAIGALCVIDHVPRVLTEAQQQALRVLSRQVMANLELYRHTRELMESEAKFRQMAENITDVLWITSPDLNQIHYVSPAYEQVWGRSAEDLYVHPHEWFDSILLEDRARVFAAFASLMKDEPTVSVEYRIGHLDGTVRWIHDRGFQVRDAAGTLLRLTGIASDITDRKQAEKASLRLGAIVEYSDDAIIGKNLDGIITSWNRGAEKIFGYTAEEMVGNSIMRLIPADRRNEETQILEKIRRGESIEHFETLRQTKDGRLIDISVTASPIKDAAGNPIGVSKIARDITARKKGDESLQLFRTLMDRSNDAIEVVDPETGRFLDVNETACRRLGYSREELLTMHVPDVATVDGSRPDMKADVAEIKKNGFKIIEARQRRKDGSTFPVEVNVQYIDLNRGYLISVVRDISERKEAEAQLLWRTAFFEAQVHSARDGILVVNGEGKKILQNQRMIELWNIPREFADETDDQRQLQAVSDQLKDPGQFLEKVAYLYAHPDEVSNDEIELKDGRVLDRHSSPVRGRDGTYYGRIWTFHDITQRKRAEEQITEQAALLDKAQDAILVGDLDGTILFWNKGAENMYGWTRDEVLGRKVADRLYADPEMFKKVVAQILDKGELSGEIEHLTKDGRKLIVEARRTLIRDDLGKPKSVLVIYTDITEKKKIEAQFMRAQRMESIGTLAGGVAHDLNNILAPIMMSIDVLKSTTENPQATQILETIEVSAKRGADIVRQVLSFARGLEGQRIEIQPKHLLKDLENIIKDTFPKDIRLQFSIPKDMWTILGDPTQVHQILLNLCVNARDAMPNGGNLLIGVENCELDHQYAAMNIQAKAGRYVNFKVTDSGIGMSPELIDKIFEPFFTTKDFNKGTGLGLSTVMAIVKSHEGIINVYSEPGKGTTFKVYLPAVKLSSGGLLGQAEPGALPRGHNETILIVDDEASILTITSQTLQAFGYKVLTATDGADAVGVYARNMKEIAIVLTDMMMPVMDGSALIHALTRMDPAVKIVAASGLNANASVASTSGLGVKHFLTKPYTAGTLLKTMRMILDEKA